MDALLKGWKAILVFTTKPAKEHIEHKEKDVVKNPWKKFTEELDFIDDGKHSGFFWYVVLLLLYIMFTLCLV